MKALQEQSAKANKNYENEFIDAIVGNERIRTVLLASVLGFVVITIVILYIFFRNDYNA